MRYFWKTAAKEYSTGIGSSSIHIAVI